MSDHVRESLRYLIAREDESHDAYALTLRRGILDPSADALLRNLMESCAARAIAYRTALALLDVPADDPGPMSLAASLAAHSIMEV